MHKRRICVVTGTRAEYGLLYWLMKELQADPAVDFQLIATGMHLSPEFGLTYRQIEADGFTIHEKVEMLLSSDTPVGVTKSLGLATVGFADAFSRLQPDILVLLGDRYEILAAAQAAMVARIPIAHIHGGETTEGVIDEAIRHAVTKMAHFHFVAAEPYRRRVIQLGEHPSRVMTVGAPGLDNIAKLHLLSRVDLERELHFSLGEDYFLVTYHPVTLSNRDPSETMRALFSALDAFTQAKIVFTKPNSDAGGRIISRLIDEYAADQPERVLTSESLGQIRYLSAMKHAGAVIGNSSSGILEAPTLKKATVNIGSRQQGRLMAPSVLCCGETPDEIRSAIHKALSPEFQAELPLIVSPYGRGDASRRIKDFLAAADLDNVLVKTFYDTALNAEQTI